MVNNKNAQFNKTVGSYAEVFHGTAKRTSGRLTKSDLTKNPQGRIVSKKKRAQGLKQYKKNPSVLDTFRAPSY
jgi:hypothetical protein